MTNFDKILEVAQKRQGQSQTLKLQDSTVSLEQIKDREQDTRPLNPKHVESLAESIAVLGLIEPLVIDNQFRLLAGGHRLAAIRLLKEQQVDKYLYQFPDNRIPIRMLPFDAESDPDLALQVEIAENEQRRDYTPNEVRALSDRLRTAGFIDVKGRPKKGQKPLMPALAVVVGKNLRTVQRYLEANQNTDPEKSTTSVVLLKQASTKLKQWQKIEPKTPQEKALAERLPEIMNLIENVLNNEQSKDKPELKAKY
ncbi:ParB/RepB/Spo0J family partition protein [Nostoc parmelioides]|uniref:ParB N-terminal domain-containing protein n=1 Tax=Nostoc parmelioides FACHB-3921 TaxID=2692909 RepID=A0ABR8BLK7_9NOSO|nr:ParB/RepB/Spo0J family partition protein [Nostoc parmelioides]MBD2254765.1 ParB N-terminal domain-containing protein [Nostoc parmelioides FACHB-3921]